MYLTPRRVCGVFRSLERKTSVEKYEARVENMPGSVINQPERLKRLESPFSLFLCGVAAGRCSSYLDSLATDATHVPRSCCCEQRSSFSFFFFPLLLAHFFPSLLHFSQPSSRSFSVLHEREKTRGKDLQESLGIDDKSAHGKNKGLSRAYVSRIRDWGRLWGFVSL